MKLESTICVLGVLTIAVVGIVQAQRTGTEGDAECTAATACEPWDFTDQKPSCARGSRIPFQFKLDVAWEDYDIPTPICNINGSHNVTYAFCPKVDELQAFNLTLAGQLSATYFNATTGKTLPSNTNGSFLSVRGFGTWMDRLTPQRIQSEGAVMVAGVCPNGDTTQTAIVPFVVLNISMKNGRFQYYRDWPQPAGVGFAPTCTVASTGKDICILDPDMECLGPPGAKNCAFCYEAQTEAHAEEMSKIHTQVWTSYYGTDKNGRQMRSGSNNPLNFQQFGGGAMYSQLSTSLDKVESGGFGGDPSDPSVRIRKHVLQMRSNLKQ